jgi:hypothetical protein
MIKTTAMFLDELREYGSPKSKLSRMVKRSECFPITRGLYETDPNVPAHLLAGSIYGPSYISFEYALSCYGLIPEAVYTVTCATFEKKKKKKYETAFGTFTYRDVPSEAFPLGIRLVQEGDYFYRIAEPEKALCDQLYTMPPVPNTQELLRLLTDDLRVEEAELRKLDASKVCGYSDAFHATNIKKLCSLLRRI